MTRQRTFVLLFGLVVTVATLWLALKEADLQQLWEILIGVDLVIILPLIVIYSIHFIFKAHRWQLLLRPIYQPTFAQTWHPMMIGFFANNLLPAHLGEFVRMYFGARLFSLKYSQVLTSMVLERLFDLLIVLLIMGGALSLGGMLPPLLQSAGKAIIGVAVLGFMIAWLMVHRISLVIHITQKLLFFIPHRFRDSVLHQLSVGATGLAAVSKPSLLLAITFSSLIQWLLVGGMIAITFHSIGLELPISAALITLVATVFAVSLPSSPGFFGPIQLAFVLALAPYEVNETSAVAASIVFHFIVWSYVNIMGLISMTRLGVRPQELDKDAQVAMDMAEK